jgi:hypothetical protein
MSIKTIQELLDEHPNNEIFFLHVPRKRYTKTDLIHYQGKVSPEVQYQRDDRLRGYLEQHGVAVLDLPPRIKIFELRGPISR